MEISCKIFILAFSLLLLPSSNAETLRNGWMNAKIKVEPAIQCYRQLYMFFPCKRKALLLTNDTHEQLNLVRQNLNARFTAITSSSLFHSYEAYKMWFNKSKSSARLLCIIIKYIVFFFVFKERWIFKMKSKYRAAHHRSVWMA